MSNSSRGPLSGVGAPFVMHLERVCRLMEMGAAFVVEFNPNCDIGPGMVRDMRLRVLEGGEVEMETVNGYQTMRLNLTLSNYRRIWRCWQNGTPTPDQRRAASWG